MAKRNNSTNMGFFRTPYMLDVYLGKKQEPCLHLGHLAHVVRVVGYTFGKYFGRLYTANNNINCQLFYMSSKTRNGHVLFFYLVDDFSGIFYK